MNYFNEGNKFYNMQDYLKAIDYYKQSAAKNLNKACSYYNSGVCFIKLKNFDEAIVMLNKAISLKHESKYFFNLAYCYVMKECFDKALRLFNIAWAIDPNDNDCEKAVNLVISKIKY
ncbi:tetratricopeptide repeat protein [Clostridium saccharobutylicum]|uniref:Tetratricopeptide TPR_1 repeat-containing protein n=1 Tax=Clostridium saccharobutylicum DSM 13864 TaxID=1345695 RepID=U5MSG5_CLOSA|nr:tetratricopeptide repeat protein [Clostridium saccharobutylicum]AGX43754.1 tetratricopeptide TPR_1 repeat-containing protein [Clostridium saccharobutylicum DSM 13864]AQR91052.1 tetratricopeptide repeat protein [Clostridium saccharobutylicum]AQS00956.1 tetratricopeptide repeat protein [Clostridium saccharobutylicum]AQS10694.1 tetratricopeptide repeat protein [Clostridium saccharobutylicum]AQS14939.1 tetratricopeptide repeat protein [Clostridium saccharobutylicum]